MAHGGRRPGAGRKKGPGTIAREAAKAAIDQHIAKHAARLVQVQLALALGATAIVMRRGKDGVGPTVVRNRKELRAYFEGAVDVEDYYLVTGGAPNTATITDLLNRGFGTPRQTIDMPEHPYRPLFALPGNRLPDMDVAPRPREK